MGSQVSELEKQKRAGEAGSRGGKQHGAGHKGLVRPWDRSLTGKHTLFSIILGTVVDAPHCPRTRTDEDGCSWLQISSLLGESSSATRPGQHIPEALAVVELALSQVALDQMDVLLAGRTGTAECGALGPLHRVRGGIILTYKARGAWGEGHELLPSPQLL